MLALAHSDVLNAANADGLVVVEKNVVLMVSANALLGQAPNQAFRDVEARCDWAAPRAVAPRMPDGRPLIEHRKQDEATSHDLLEASQGADGIKVRLRA